MHAERPFIVGVDERLDSPETAALKYEEAVARANGGDIRGVTPPSLLSMATYAKAPAAVHGMLGAGVLLLFKTPVVAGGKKGKEKGKDRTW